MGHNPLYLFEQISFDFYSFQFCLMKKNNVLERLAHISW